MPPVAVGRRERNKAEKQRRIQRAAAELFAEHGYAGTTTQQVAAGADVADGTLFRYAATKAELLLMVVNHQLAPRLAEGRAAAFAAGSLSDAVLAVIRPLADLAREQPDLTAVFLRELLFGDDGPHRREALELTDGAVHTISALLEPAAGGGLPDDLPLEEAARWVFSALTLEVLRTVLRRRPSEDLLRVRVRVLLRGLGLPVE